MTPIRRAVRSAKEKVLAGRDLSTTLGATGQFSPDVIAVIATGEETGKLPESLEHLADEYDEQIAVMVKNLGQLVQPLVTIVLGADRAVHHPGRDPADHPDDLEPEPTVMDANPRRRPFMPLRDHFHAPLFPQRSWESLHSRLAVAIADHLDSVLPSRFIAEVETHLGSHVEADLAEFERGDDGEWKAALGNGPGGGVAVEPWAPPVATWSMPAVFPDVFEVQVWDEGDDMRLVAVLELVSPRNKDRPESRLTFASKCAAYLQRGIGLVVVDLVTDKRFNLHNELVPLLNLDSSYAMAEDPHLYVVSYRPIQRGDSSLIDAWPSALSVGATLPLVPFCLRGFRAIPLDLEALYEGTCRRARI